MREAGGTENFRKGVAKLAVEKWYVAESTLELGRALLESKEASAHWASVFLFGGTA